jgi:hypothetical protein
MSWPSEWPSSSPVADDGVDVDQPGFEPLPPGKGKKTLGQLGTVAQDGVRLPAQLGDARLRVGKLGDHLEIDDGQGEQVVEIVRNAQ